MSRPRVVVWFSCGAASAVAAWLTLNDQHGNGAELVYCDTGSEHPDRRRDAEAFILAHQELCVLSHAVCHGFMKGESR